MKRVIKYLLAFCCVLTLSGYVYSECTTYEEMKPFTQRDYFGSRGYIRVYLNSTAMKFNTKLKKMEIGEKHQDFVEIDMKIKDGEELFLVPVQFYNPRIIEKNGKKYITADNIPEDILIKNKDLLVLESENIEYNFVDLQAPYRDLDK